VVRTTTTTRRRKKKKKIPKIVATFIYTSSQGQRTHSAQTNSGKKILDPPGPLGRFFVFLKIFFENFEKISADTCAKKFPLVSMGG
jgi:hypothetical protein